MKFTAPKLKFAQDALDPYVSAETVHYHYDKHTKGYFDKVNELIKGTKFEDAESLEDLLTNNTLMKADGKLYNQVAQAWNHAFYWEGLNDHLKTGRPNEALSDLIEMTWKTPANFKKEFVEAAKGQFGSGWAWLNYSNDKLSILTTEDAHNPLTSKQTPLFVIDVWEHAYYLDYQNDREKYLKNVWQVIDWEVVNERLTKARS